MAWPNGETLIEWNLENSTGNEYGAFRNGVVLTAGDSLVFEVTCGTVGDANAGTCTTALLVNGQFRPVG